MRDRHKAGLSMQQQLDQLTKVHTGLTYEKQGLNWLVYGQLKFVSKAIGELIGGIYDIKMTIPSRFPHELPSVWETEGQIERSPDNHVYTDTGTLCMGTKMACLIKAIKNKTILNFVNQQLVPFLTGYSYFCKFGRWPFGELSHDDLGILEYYRNYFDVDNDQAVLRLLYLANSAQYKNLNRLKPCVCGSKNQYGDCHYENVKLLSKPVFKDELQLNYAQCLRYINRKPVLTKIAQSTNKMISLNEKIS